MSLLDKKKLIGNKKFQINIKKNIPQKSGMGGGSMNASCILKHLIKKKIVILSAKKTNLLANAVGSDVGLGLEKKTTTSTPNNDKGGADLLVKTSEQIQPVNQKKVWRKSDTNKMSDQEFERYEKDIMIAQSEGRLINE